MIQIYDIELYPNFFCCNFIDLERNKKSFILFEDKNEISELLQFLKNVKGLVGFNCIKFDSQVLNYIIKNPNSSIEKIYEIGQKTFEEGFFPSKPLILNLDLFLIHHYDNKNKATSLKWVEFSMNIKNIQSLPIEPNALIQADEVDKLVEYCFNDCEATLDFYLLTKGITEHPLYKGIDKIQFRRDIQSKYGISCLNYNDVKIGTEIGLDKYIEISKKDKNEVKKLRTYRKTIKLSDCIENNISFKSEVFQKFLTHLKSLTVKPNQIKEEEGFTLYYKNVEFEFGYGGLHTVDKPRIIKKSNNNQIIDADVTSYYPSAIINRNLYPKHLGVEFIEAYKAIFEQRVEAKKLSKTDKSYQSVNEALKLSLNGTYGQTNSQYSYLYDPLVTFKVTINNQLCLLMLCETLLDNNINLLSVNTDGLVCLVNNDQVENYNKICKDWEVSTNFQLEYTYYNKLIQTSVNDYIAEKTNGELKFKGDFTIDFEIHKNPSSKIVPLALKEYFINNINYIDYIRNHKNIFDFCIGVKAKDYLNIILYYYEDGKIQNKIVKEKVVRYYVSKHLTTIKKIYNKDVVTKKGLRKKGTVLNLEKGYNLTYFNKYEEKDNYNINYEYYIERVRKIVNSIEQDNKSNQLSLFE